MPDFDLPEACSPQPDALSDSGHSRFQIEHFIATRGNWTPWGKLQQARRELRKRRFAETELKDDIELAEIERTEVGRRWCFRSTTRRRRDLRLRQLDRRIAELKRSRASNQRELREFETIERHCTELVGPVTPERQAALDAETWRTRIRAMAAIDVLTRGGISHATLELICAIPKPERESILREIRAAIETGRDRPESALLGWLDAGDAETTSRRPPSRHLAEAGR
ncbi:MAG: hypothetical protein AB7O26_15985 [Planctomycetaceae bacterium]